LTLFKNSWSDFWGQFFSHQSGRNLVLSEVETFPEDVNTLWDKLSPKFYAIVKRDCAHLNWKYVSQPHVNYHRIIARKDGEVCGYLVMRKGTPPERNIGIISDIFVDPGDSQTIEALFSYAITFFREQKVPEIIAATTVPEYQRYLLRKGFVKTGEEHPVIHARVKSPAVEVALQPGKWFLGRSDHDWDQFPFAR
jgi:hypothetical protein